MTSWRADELTSWRARRGSRTLARGGGKELTAEKGQIKPLRPQLQLQFWPLKTNVWALFLFLLDLKIGENIFATEKSISWAIFAENCLLSERKPIWSGNALIWWDTFHWNLKNIESKQKKKNKWKKINKNKWKKQNKKTPKRLGQHFLGHFLLKTSLFFLFACAVGLGLSSKGRGFCFCLPHFQFRVNQKRLRVEPPNKSTTAEPLRGTIMNSLIPTIHHVLSVPRIAVTAFYARLMLSSTKPYFNYFGLSRVFLWKML